MVKIALDSQEAAKYLVELSKHLAEAIVWSLQQRKRITFEVPPDYAKQKAGGSCLLWAPPPGCTEAEILIGILKTMQEKGHRRPRPKRHK